MTRLVHCPSCGQTAEGYAESTKITHCKPCWRAYSKRWRDTHKANVAAWYEKGKDQWNKNRKLGGASLYDEMLAAQGGVCAICRQSQSGRFKTLCVDHCHETGKIRGLLCSNCNRAIGLLSDHAPTVRQAVAYLERQ